VNKGFGNRWRQRGKENYKLKLTNKNYKYKNRLESSKQVVGPISAQTLVDWRLDECGNKFIDSESDNSSGECFFTECVSIVGTTSVVRVLGCRSRGPGSIPGTTKKIVVGLERGPLSLVNTTEELLDRKVAAPV
jgi:hypothetical protein